MWGPPENCKMCHREVKRFCVNTEYEREMDPWGNGLGLCVKVKVSYTISYNLN